VTYGSIRLMDEVVRTITVHKERMAVNSDAYWSTTSHLADELVRRHDISFRSAHNIVAVFVRQALELRQTPHTVEARLLAAAGREVAGVEIDLDDVALRRMLDGRNFIETRASEGSVSPVEVRRHAAGLRKEVATQQAAFAEWRVAADNAIGALLARAGELSPA
jgi:argininosuccinate lyase